MASKKRDSLDSWLSKDGEHVYYLRLTDELLLHDKTPPKGRKYHLYMHLGDKNDPIDLGPVDYIGEL